RDERQVDVKAIGFADIQGKLPNGLKVGHAFDVADGAPDFSNDDVHVVGSEFVNRGLDLVGDVWNDLDGLALVFPVAFLFDYGQIDPAGGEIGIAIERGVGESFVVAEVEVSFGAVIQHVNLAVLIGAHGSGVDVDVGIELLQADTQATSFQQQTHR